MTRILTILALLFVTPSWATEIDGNSFICSENQMPVLALQFQWGVARFNGQEVNSYKYEVFSKHVNIGEIDFGNVFYQINRKTLELEKKYLWDPDGPRLYDLNPALLHKYKCEFMNFEEASKLAAETLEKMRIKAEEGNQF